MRNLSKILFLFGIVTLTAFGCEDDGEFEQIEFKKITDFDCNDCSISLKSEYFNNDYYIIRSEESFLKYVDGVNIPVIDFNKYILIIGHKILSTDASVINEKVEENNIEILYTVSIRKNDATIPTAVIYYVFIEKANSGKDISVKFEELN